MGRIMKPVACCGEDILPLYDHVIRIYGVIFEGERYIVNGRHFGFGSSICCTRMSDDAAIDLRMASDPDDRISRVIPIYSEMEVVAWAANV